MSIRSLTSAVPPPPKPLDTKGNWTAAEIVVGAKYPTDFRSLISRYGSGSFFNGFLTVYNPLTVEGLARIKQAEKYLREYRVGLFPLPLAVHPETPGLLPWGGNENGNDYCWLTKGTREKWPVVFVGHGHASSPLQYRMTMTRFLADYARDKLEPFAKAEDPMTDEMRVFTPRRG